jgi:hypothetical protein
VVVELLVDANVDADLLLVEVKVEVDEVVVDVDVDVDTVEYCVVIFSVGC